MLLTKFKNLKNVISPIKFEVKEFFPNRTTQTIFEGCSLILQKEKQGRFQYNTDGLIFSHAFYGVGGTEINKSGPKTKITWDYSFKWKPPHFNTIDFLVKTIKTDTGDDSIYSIFENGLSTNSAIQFNEYKKIELNCGFNEDYDGYINPCQDIIDDIYPVFKENYNKNLYKHHNTGNIVVYSLLERKIVKISKDEYRQNSKEYANLTTKVFYKVDNKFFKSKELLDQYYRETRGKTVLKVSQFAMSNKFNDIELITREEHENGKN
jgi:hypothetical protein